MTTFLKEWEKAKKEFQTKIAAELKNGGQGIPADFRNAVVTLVKTDTGMTPALKDVDAAFTKKHRKAAMEGLTKVHGVIEKAAMAVQKIALGAGGKAAEATDDATVDALNEIQNIGLDFKRKLTAFETDIAKAIEKLQEAKSPTGAKIDIISLEGDLEGAVNQFKKDVKAHAALEKVHKVLESIKPAIKSMHDYSKAAARTDVDNALTSLESFFAGVDKLDTLQKKIAAMKPALDADYVKAVKDLRDALNTIKTQRGNVSHKNLKQLKAAAG